MGVSTKQYELTILIHPDLELDIEKPLTNIRAIMKDAGGEITSENNWGKKRLTYPINKQHYAIYIHFELSLPPDGTAKLSNVLNITNAVLRYLLVGIDEKIKAKLASAHKRRTQQTDNEKEETNGKKH